MLDTLVNRQNAHVTRICQTAMAVDLLQASKNLRAAVGLSKDAVYEISARLVYKVFANCVTSVVQQAFSVAAEELLDVGTHSHFFEPQR